LSERGYTSRDVASLRGSGSKLVSKTLEMAADQDVLQLGSVASKISYQSSGTLVATVEVSLNGSNWVSAGADSTAAAIVSFDAHNSIAVRVTWVSGSGKIHLAG